MSSFLEPIPCQVVKITAEELEVRFPKEIHALKPGLLLRLENGEAHDAESDPASEQGALLYGRLEALKIDPAKSASQEGILAKIHVILGEADFSLTRAIALSNEVLAEEVSRLVEPLEYPIALGNQFSVDFAQYHTLTVLSGPSLDDKLVALSHWLEGLSQYQRLVVIDPLGILEEELLPLMPGKIGAKMGALIKAGADASLSLQSVGIKRFLSVLSSMLPDVIRTEAIQLLAEVLPIGQNFVPFKELLRVETLTERSADGPSRQALSMKTPLLNCLYEIDRQRVFADTPREVLSLNQALKTPVTVIDLAGLCEPWKTLFYEEICFEVLANAGGNVMPVFIYPDNYLCDLPDYIKKLNEADISALAIASPYLSNDLQTLADNRMHWNTMGDLYLEGALTFGLPVKLDLPFPPESWSKNLSWSENSNPTTDKASEGGYFSGSEILSRAYAQPGALGTYDEENPLQARYQQTNPQQAMVAAPFPGGAHLSSYNLDEEETEELIGAAEASAKSSQANAATAGEDSLDEWFYAKPQSEEEKARAIFESSQWQQTLQGLAQAAGISLPEQPEPEPGRNDVSRDDESSQEASDAFDSILGPVDTVLSGEAPAEELSLAGSFPVHELTPEELGGDILLGDPEFVSPEAIARSLQAAGVGAGLEEAAPESSEVISEKSFEQDILQEFQEDFQASPSPHGLPSQTLPAEQSFEDDFHFDLSLLPETPLPELAASLEVSNPPTPESMPEQFWRAEAPAEEEPSWNSDYTNTDTASPALETPHTAPPIGNGWQTLEVFPESGPSETQAETVDAAPEALSNDSAEVEFFEEKTEGASVNNDIPKGTVIMDEPPPVRPRSLSSPDLQADEEPLSPALESPNVSEAGASPEGFGVGDRVLSDKYGEGTVQKLIPMEMTTAVHVLFDSGAKRTIVPTGNNLKPI